jgi:hypothetical protein
MAGGSGSVDLGGDAGRPEALNGHIERVFDPTRKEHHWGRRKLARNR